MAPIDLSFSRYVANRKQAGPAPDGAEPHYAYSGDLRVRATLDGLTPVTVAVKAALNVWRAVDRNRILGTAARVGEKQFARIHRLVCQCADALGMPAPAFYASAQLKPGQTRTLGSPEDAMVVMGSRSVDALSDEDLLFVIGRECGHIQNGHSTYLTALYFVTSVASNAVQWAARPAALALNGWSRRAAITADRAGLLCVRDLQVATGLMIRQGLGSKKLYREVDSEEYLRQLAEDLGGVSRFHELFATSPYLPKRVKALQLFAQTAVYRSRIEPEGDPASWLSREECDARVGELLAVLR